MAKKSKPAKTYVDTSAFIAFLDGSDTYHPLFRRLFATPPPLITTGLVIAEAHGWFLRRYDRTRAFQFLAFVEDLTVLSTSHLGTEELKAALAVMRSFPDQDLTLADAAGLSLLEKEGSRLSCWSTDFHLGLTGVPLVIHQY